MSGHLFASVVGEALAKFDREGVESLGKLLARLFGFALRDLTEHEVPGRTFDERADKCIPAEDQIAFPVASDGTTFHVWRTVMDAHHLSNLPTTVAEEFFPMLPLFMLPSKMREQLFAESSPWEDIQTCVDGFMRHMHSGRSIRSSKKRRYLFW
jgi:hypothetical protein